jgi:hypothetical protein
MVDEMGDMYMDPGCLPNTAEAAAVAAAAVVAGAAGLVASTGANGPLLQLQSDHQQQQLGAAWPAASQSQSSSINGDASHQPGQQLHQSGLRSSGGIGGSNASNRKA